MSVESVKETQTDIENILTVKRNQYIINMSRLNKMLLKLLDLQRIFIRYKLSSLFRSSSVVELSAVNRSVVGSESYLRSHTESTQVAQGAPLLRGRSLTRCEGSNPSSLPYILARWSSG